MNLKVDKLDTKRICQGDIIRNVDCVEYAIEKKGVVEVSRIEFSLVIVLTQDCNLEQDYKIQCDTQKPVKDKMLILNCESSAYQNDFGTAF